MANQIINQNNQSALETIKEVKYELLDGLEITLNEQVIRNITNNNQYITNGEINLFIEKAKMLKVNPLIGEYQLIKYDNSKPAQHILSINAFQRTSDINPNFEGMEDGIVVQKQNGEIVEREGCIVYPKEILLGGWAKAYRKDRRIPITAKLSLNEYNKRQSTWNQMQATMINKCAKVACLRKAFPSMFSGVYSQEELESSGGLENSNNKIEKKEYDIDGIINDIKEKVPSETIMENSISTENVNFPQAQDYTYNTYDNQYQQNQGQNFNGNYDQQLNYNYNENNNGYNNQPQIFEIDYRSVYLANKEMYNLIPNSYNKETRTCRVTIKPEYQKNQGQN